MMRHFNLLTEQVDFRSELLEGLSAVPKITSPKHLYDERGSRLFDEECDQPEYYLPDAEREIMKHNAADIAERVGSNACIIEPGSGATEKVRVLLDEMDVDQYVPIDISTEFLLESAKGLQKDYPDVTIDCISADFTQMNDLPAQVRNGACETVVYFPGSTIGNFDTDRARELLTGFKGMLGTSGYLVIGVDLKKDRRVLERAYNDEAGIGESLHKNLLHRANREAGADFDPEAFRYQAVYNESKGRMEMSLVSRKNQDVAVDGETVAFEEGERWHTQRSYKYSPEEFRELAAECGFDRVHLWTDSDNLMSVQLFRG